MMVDLAMVVLKCETCDVLCYTGYLGPERNGEVIYE